MGIDALVAERYLELAPMIDARDPAVRALVEQAIAYLLDDARIVQFSRRGLIGERVLTHDTFRAIIAGKLSPGQLAGTAGSPVNGGSAMAPLVYRADAVTLDYMTIALSGIDAPSKRDFAPTSARLAAIESATRSGTLEIFASILMPSIDRALATRFRVITDRHFAAAALAIRLYQQDHAGARPETFNDLVPKYLPAVPSDAISGKPIRYDAKRAILWGVGDDEIDGEGDTSLVHANWRADRYNMRDTVVFLDPQPRPATQPASE